MIIERYCEKALLFCWGYLDRFYHIGSCTDSDPWLCLLPQSVTATEMS